MFQAKLNGDQHHASFALVTRVRNYGGDFEIAREVKLTDMRLRESSCSRTISGTDYLRFFGAIMINRLSKARWRRAYACKRHRCFRG